MKRILTIILMMAFAASMSAQDNTEIPAYRNKGYAGSVSFNDHMFLFLGLDTSHGYMFNEHHYLGGGLGFYITPLVVNDVVPMTGHIYAEYKSYLFKKRSTPTVGFKMGYAIPISDDPVDRQKPDQTIVSYYKAFEFEPYVGWDWGLKSGKGISLALGADILTDFKDYLPVLKLSVGISF